MSASGGGSSGAGAGGSSRRADKDIVALTRAKLDGLREEIVIKLTEAARLESLDSPKEEEAKLLRAQADKLQAELVLFSEAAPDRSGGVLAAGEHTQHTLRTRRRCSCVPARSVAAYCLLVCSSCLVRLCSARVKRHACSAIWQPTSVGDAQPKNQTPSKATTTPVAHFFSLSRLLHRIFIFLGAPLVQIARHSIDLLTVLAVLKN